MNPFLIIIICLFLYMTAWFVVSIVKKRNDVADVAWGLGFPIVAWLMFFMSGFSFRSFLVNILITIWGWRLASHIYKRNKDKKEDYRYEKWRKEWKYFYIRSFFQVFILQGFLLFIIALPALMINKLSPTGIDRALVLGIIIWLIGFYFESRGDKELAEFIKNPNNKGKILKTGLWKYTRHPNYFGEVSMWWGIFLMGAMLKDGLLTIIGPLTITILIVYISGIPLLEKKFEGNKEFEEYKKKTSMFFPWWPKD